MFTFFSNAWLYIELPRWRKPQNTSQVQLHERHPTSHPWRAKKMDTTSVSNSLLISFYEESNCICLPQVTSEIEWDRQTPKELAMLKRLKGRDAEESEVGAEDFINANTTSQLTEEGRTWVCMSRVTF